MYAITIDEPGGPEVLRWTEVPDPEPGLGEVLVDITASAVNRADLLQRAGLYDPPPGASPYLGLECSGRISRLGPRVDTWHVGNEVCALLAGGGYAEKVAVPAGQLLPIPSGVSLEDAAALPEVACTVWSNLIQIGHMTAGQTLLIHGGGSGIGTFAIQFAHARGVKVITTARASKHDKLQSLGADVTIDYTEEDFVEKTMTATDGHGVDLILDIQGASYLDRNVRTLAEGGQLIVIGLQGGRTGTLDLGQLMDRRASVTSTRLRSRSPADKAAIVAGVRADVWPLAVAGKVTPIVDRSLPMSQAVIAHEVVGANAHLGKVVLVTEGG
jgi:putative PIG3 family NAD(P)H quinone oxidoreductase